MIDLININYGTKIEDLEPGETFSYSGGGHPDGYYILSGFESSSGKMLGVELMTGNTQGFEKDESVEVLDFVMMPKQKYMKEKTREISEKKKAQSEDQKQYKTKQEKEMLLDFLNKTIELRRFPKTRELDEDPNMEDYRVYYNSLGSKSNICDMVIFEITRDTLDSEFMEVLNKLCDSCEEYEGYDECDRHPTYCLLEEIKIGKAQKASYGS